MKQTNNIPQFIAGPCSAESREQVLEVAKELLRGGHADCLRAGVWKPRTMPNCFEGVGEVALEWLREAKELTGLPIACEVATAQHVHLALKYGVDVLWVGARTTVNPFYVQEIADSLKGREDIVVMLKNPVNPDIQLWIGAIERLRNAGVTQIAAIHRGFTADKHTPYRNDPRWDLVAEIRSRYPELPVLCDPSHIAGSRKYIKDISLRAMEMDMYGLMIEVHPEPNCALSDAAQQILPSTYNKLINSIKQNVSNSVTTKDTLRDLNLFRREIDSIDKELLQLLARRMQLSGEIGDFKKRNNLKILQIKRWEEMLASRTKEGINLGLDPQLIRSMLELLHKASVDIQSTQRDEF